MLTYHGITIQADEIIKYARKSRSDDPLLSVEEVLEKHEKILNEWCERNLGELIPASNSFQEIGSGETIEARPDFQKVLRLIESQKYKAILTVDVQRLSRGDLEVIPASSPTSMIHTPCTCSYASLPCIVVKVSENHGPPSFAIKADLPSPWRPRSVSI